MRRVLRWRGGRARRGSPAFLSRGLCGFGLRSGFGLGCGLVGPTALLAGAGLGLIGAWLAMFVDIHVRASFFLFRFIRGAWLKTKV